MPEWAYVVGALVLGLLGIDWFRSWPWCKRAGDVLNEIAREFD